jgi:stage III sporulation protein AD
VLCVVLLNSILNTHAKEYALILMLCVSVGILIYLSGYVSTLLDFIRQLLEYTSNSDIYAILLKALGICVVTNIAMDVCKDSHQNTLCGVVLLVGKVAILLIAIPLLQEIFNTTVMLINK